MTDYQIEKYLFQPKSIKKLIKEDSIIVFDTNVLLMAYQWRKVTLTQIKKVIQDLDRMKRLKFSLQTLKEFSENRDKQIQNQINDVDKEISKLQNVKKINELAPIMEGAKIFEDAVLSQKEFLRSEKLYKEKLLNIKKELSSLFTNDEFVSFLSDISKNNIIQVYTEKQLTELEVEAKKRFEKCIPPGYKDANKNYNSSGDYIIWNDLISLNRNVIFVSSDIKKDWVSVSIDGKIMYSQPFLIQEFYERTKGKSFVQITPQEFIKYWNPKIDNNIVSDLENTFKRIDRQDIIKRLREAGLKYYPGTVTEAVFSIGPEKILLMNNAELKKMLDDYFLDEMISLSNMDLPDGEESGKIKKALEESFDLNNFQVTDRLVNVARAQAQEYLANLLINKNSISQ